MGVSDPIAQTPEFQAMASRLGLSTDQATGAADALLPAIMGGFKNQMHGAQGGDLGAMLGMFGGGLFGGAQQQAPDVDSGNEVLGQIFGSKDVSRAVAQNASAQTGLDASLLKQMLPVLASIVTAYLSRQGQDAGAAQAPSGGLGGLGGLLGGLLGGGAAQPAQQQGASPLSSLLGMLDANGDGNPLDDILRMAGKAQR